MSSRSKRTAKRKSASTQGVQRLRGRGDYTTVEPGRFYAGRDSAGKTVPSKVGMALRSAGASIGGAYGQANLGYMAGAAISRLIGSGDYTVQSNSLLAPSSSRLNSAALVMGPDGRRGIRVQERELIGYVTSSTAFNATSYIINPANSTTFPWLSGIAQSFDEWEPNGIAFSFRSTSAAYNGTNQTLGMVAMATEYDWSDSIFRSRIELESSAYACSTKASEDLVHLIECEPKERSHTVLNTLQSAAVPSGTSADDYHLGRFVIATDGQSTAGLVLGELWVSYDITFFKKQLYNSILGYGINHATLTWNVPDIVGFSSSSLLCTSNPSSTRGNMRVLINTAGNQITLPDIQAGCYNVSFFVVGKGPAGVTTFSPPVLTPVNCVLVSNGPRVDTSTKIAGDSAFDQKVGWSYCFNVTGPSPKITISWVIALTTFDFIRFTVAQVAPEDVLLTPELRY